MPLIPRDNGGEVEVSIGEDTYWLRRYLGWYDRQRASDIKGAAIHLPWGQVKDGDIRVGMDERVPMTMGNMEDVQLTKLAVWLKRWSHSEPITERTLKRLPQSHADRLLEEIARLADEQEGPSESDPLGKSSGESSVLSSDNGAQLSPLVVTMPSKSEHEPPSEY